MIALGLRLVLNSGREAVTRLIVVAAAVALGVGLLLTALATTSAVSAWSSAHAWEWTGTDSVPAGPPSAAAPLWWHPSVDVFDGQQITRFDVAATGASSPVPPGLPADPRAGQYYASPALAALIRGTPADELADRYPGRLAGLIGDAGLPSPGSLILIVGRTPAQLAATPFSIKVASIASAVPVNAGGGSRNISNSVNTRGSDNPLGLSFSPPEGEIPASTSDLILSVVALAVLAPVLIFITTATRLSAARREQRFAAMRLTGATRSQVSQLAAVESTVAAVLGVAAGFGLFFLLRTPVAGIPFIGEPFFPDQLTLSGTDIALVAIGIPVAAAVAARLALLRVHISPLGVARRVTPKPPGAWRLLPLLIGFADLIFFILRGKPSSPAAQVQAFVPGYLLIIVGLITAGPWLTMAAARLTARWTRRPAALLAARRLADDPKAAFRAVSGLVLALLITTAAVVAITTQDSVDVTKFGTVALSNVMTNQLADQQFNDNSADPTVSTGAGLAATAAPVAARLNAIPGVGGVVVVRADPGLSIPGTFHGLGVNNFGGGTSPVSAGVVSCAQLATVPALGKCPAGATAVAFPKDGFNAFQFAVKDLSGYVWPAVSVPAGRLDRLGLDSVNVATDGTTATIERARTVLEDAYPTADLTAPSTYGDWVAEDDSTNRDYQQLANVVILVSLAIAGCTLATGIAAGLADRKRPFSLLRLTGARLSTLRRVVALEGAIPLLAVSAVAIGVGFGGAEMNASLQQGRSIVPPGAEFYFIVAGGIVAALAVIAATFPLLARITGPEVARNE